MAVYIDRLASIIQAAYINNVTVELVSEPGIGKSSVVRQQAKQMAVKLNQPFGFAVRHLSTMDPTDIAGPLFVTKRTLSLVSGKVEQELATNSYPAIFPNDTDEVFLPDGTETTVEKFGRIPAFGIVFLDELRQAPHDVQKPAARFLDEHRIGPWSLKMFGGRWGVLAASNREEDKSGTNRDLAFIKNRKLEMHVRTTADILLNYLESKGELHFMFLGFIRTFPADVFSPSVPKDDKPFPTPRSFERVGRMLVTLGHNGVPACDEEATEVAAGLIGPATASKLMGYLRVHDDIVSMADIVTDPEKCRMPSRPDVAWAVTQMMIQNATDENVMKLFTYMKRLPRENQLPLVSGISHRLPSLVYNKEYAVWSAANQQLLMAAYGADRRYKDKKVS